MKRFIFLLLMFTGAGFVQGQLPNACSYIAPHEGENWCFFINNMLSFQGGSVSSSSLPGTLSSGKGCASISDKAGNLVFYTDGMKAWNKTDQVLLYGDHLDGYIGCTQSSLIVPQPGNDNLYYIFTVDFLFSPPFGNTKGLNYSRVDMSGNNGQGELNLLNKRLMDKSPEKITGVKHANGRDIWVLAHEYDSDAFRAYLVKKSGLDTIPVISHAGSVHTGLPTTNNQVGYMKFSADGHKIALALFGMKLVELFDFDPATGDVSNAISIPAPGGRYPYGIEFSPDGSKLYFTTAVLSSGSDNNLYQIDLNAPGNPPLLLNHLFHDVTALQLAVDGKIYVARYNKNFLGCVENPNRPDSACNYRDDAFPLNAKSQLSLPNFVQSYFDIPAVTYDTKCHGDQTLFHVTNPANTDTHTWDFGDAASGAANTVIAPNPSHQFTTPGDYTITHTETFNGRSFTSALPVTIHPLPPKPFSHDSDTLHIDSLYIFPGSSISLDAGAYMASYMWQNGFSGRSFTVSEPGNYSVFIVDTNCCQNIDSIKIILLDLAVPTAFTPNGDQINDLFRVKGAIEGIGNYHFSVFNQWGQRIWETSDFLKGWDGKMKGAFCPSGLYTWLMKFSVNGNIMNEGDVVKRGTFVLLR
jgi:gliding motility-associated-like protein